MDKSYLAEAASPAVPSIDNKVPQSAAHQLRFAQVQQPQSAENTPKDASQ